jgi:hypothetical protein
MRLACLSESPRDLAPYRFGAPAAWFTWPPRGVRVAGCSVREPDALSPSGLAPLQSLTRAPRTAVHALTRFVAPSAQPSRRDPPLPSFRLPGSRCVLALTMRLDALLPRRPPWCLSTRRAHGVCLPSELDLAEVASTSRCPSPLLRLTMPDRFRRASLGSVPRYGLEAASLQGLSRCRLGTTRRIFSALRGSWLSWDSPPWGFPLPCLDLEGRARSLLG